MEVSRRSFLGGALTVAAASLIPVTAAKVLGIDNVPTLWGDGIHDDTAALQALIDGRPFIIAKTGLLTMNKPGEVRLMPKGVFRVDSTITLS